MSDDNNGGGIADLLTAAIIMWLLFLSIPIAVAGDLAFYMFFKMGLLTNAPNFLYVAAWLIPALSYGYYVKKFITNHITKDSFGIGLLMYAQGFLLLGIIAILVKIDGHGIYISKVIILGLNHILGGGWLSEYALMFGIGTILFFLGFKVAKRHPIVKKRHPKYI